jgi:methylated-DNA-[protein]-cysteine S-methyltransferase
MPNFLLAPWVPADSGTMRCNHEQVLNVRVILPLFPLRWMCVPVRPPDRLGDSAGTPPLTDARGRFGIHRVSPSTGKGTGARVPQLSLHTPIGDITVSEEDGAIVALDWGWGRDQGDSALLRRARDQLDAYFDGVLTEFDLPLAPHGTPYRRRVWQALREIPYGETRSYQEIAAKAGGSARSVGQTNGCNPIPLIIPCHRVVASSHLGGYSGGDGLVTKRWLLTLENPDAHFSGALLSQASLL